MVVVVVVVAFALIELQTQSQEKSNFALVSLQRQQQRRRSARKALQREIYTSKRHKARASVLRQIRSRRTNSKVLSMSN